MTVAESAPQANRRSVCVITGPPTHSVGETSNGRWRMSSSVVCNARICNATHQGAARDGELVVLRDYVPLGRHLVRTTVEQHFN